MEILREILLTHHLIGMAIIVGGYLSVIRSPRVLPGMLHAAYLQLVTGLLLMGLAEMGDDTVNHVKLGVKLVIAILVTVFAFVGTRRQKALTSGGGQGTAAVKAPSATMAHLAFGFAVINVIVAVFVS